MDVFSLRKSGTSPRFRFNLVINAGFLFSVALASNGSPKRYISSDTNVYFQQVLEDPVTTNLYILDQYNRIYQLSPELQLVTVFGNVSASIHPARLGSQVFFMMGNTSFILACSDGACGISNWNQSYNWQWHSLDQKVSHFKKNSQRYIDNSRRARRQQAFH